MPKLSLSSPGENICTLSLCRSLRLTVIPVAAHPMGHARSLTPQHSFEHAERHLFKHTLILHWLILRRNNDWYSEVMWCYCQSLEIFRWLFSGDAGLSRCHLFLLCCMEEFCSHQILIFYSEDGHINIPPLIVHFVRDTHIMIIFSNHPTLNSSNDLALVPHACMMF